MASRWLYECKDNDCNNLHSYKSQSSGVYCAVCGGRTKKLGKIQL